MMRYCCEALRTKLQRGEPQHTLLKRKAMVEEALAWPGGTRENPLRHVVANLPDGTEVFFLKPGKEAFRRKPNPHDMTPVVGDLTELPTFGGLWTILSRISMVDFEAFRCVLVLVYRLAYLLDHGPYGSSYRFLPQREVATSIDALEKAVGRVAPKGLYGLLAYLDMLGWNEDIKYHVEGGLVTFRGKHKFETGRINTLLTCIRVPYQVSEFARNALASRDHGRDIDFESIYAAMQAFSNGRGTCRPTHEQLLQWLSPYIVE